jgi:hypothetical protein
MKNLFTCFLLVAAIASCKKDTKSTRPEEQQDTVSRTSENDSPDPILVSDGTTMAKSTTVTTEAALKTAIANASPGDIITISGTIRLTSTLQLLKSGTSSAKINFTGGTLDCSGISSGWGVKVNGSFWNITNMTIKNAPDAGIVLQLGGNNFLNNVTSTGNKDSGIQIYNGSHDNYVLNCHSNENYDVVNGGENADGFACKLSAGVNNKFENCVANHNSDDGWDLFGQPSTVKIINCTATNNGFGTNGDGNGFKLGSAGQNVPHTVTGCTANNNKAWGYDGNGNTGHITITGSGGSGNGSGLFTRIF